MPFGPRRRSTESRGAPRRARAARHPPEGVRRWSRLCLRRLPSSAGLRRWDPRTRSQAATTTTSTTTTMTTTPTPTMMSIVVAGDEWSAQARRGPQQVSTERPAMHLVPPPPQAHPPRRTLSSPPRRLWSRGAGPDLGLGRDCASTRVAVCHDHVHPPRRPPCVSARVRDHVPSLSTLTPPPCRCVAHPPPPPPPLGVGSTPAPHQHQQQRQPPP